MSIGTVRRQSGVLAAALAALAATGCATLDELAVAETHRLGDAPYYFELRQPQPPPGACALVLAVALDPALRETFGYQDRMAEFEPILAALNARLASGVGTACVATGSALPVAGRAPRVYVGSADSEYAPQDAAAQRLASDRFAPMVMRVERPDAVWQAAVARQLAESASPYVVQVHLGVSQYMKGYSGAFRKEVVLGTGYRQPIRFLTAENKPVEVLHLTGVLVDAEAKAVRAGAEGIVLRDTPFLAQTVGAVRVFDPDELQRVAASARRDELPGAPLALDVALDNLLAQLTRGAVTVPAR